jgi:cytochrome P450
MIIEIFRDPNLLARIRSDLDTIAESPQHTGSWIEELMALPLLQSVYAEVLRLRVDVQTVFRDNREDIRVNNWTFPKKSLLLVPTRPAHRDENYWNTRDGQYPLDRFWSDRFLEFPGEPRSGPSRAIRARSEAHRNGSGQGKPKFITAGTSDSWIPYGVGERACPGRFFAQREIVAFCAIIVQNYEVRLPGLDAISHVSANDVFYGLGVQRPRAALPFRMRRLQRLG